MANEMLQPSTFRFLKDINRNNNREWFDKNRHRYEAAKNDFDFFIAKVITELSGVNPSLKGLEARNCVFRIYRDVRFSKNKDPYKSSFSASIDEGGRKSGRAGFYIHLQPTGASGNFLAGGSWMPEAGKLRAIRQEIEYNTNEFLDIINNRTFKKLFGGLEDHQLKKLPRGVEKNDPNAALYKYTSFIVSHSLDEKEFYDPAIIRRIGKSYKAMLPLLHFLNRNQN